jgi:hypothetical protein
VGEVVGRVAGLFRYPVKSMGAEALDSVDVSWHGLAGDRRWAYIRDGMTRSGFPWLTIRQRPTMWRYVPRLIEPDRPDASPIVVRTPSGAVLDVADPALAAELGTSVPMLKCDRGVFDTFPLSLLSLQSVAGLGGLAGADLEPARFRPNLLIDAVGGAAFPEDALIVIPSGVQVYSQPRWGWPCHQRAIGGRISPARFAHSVSAPAGSACGGASTVMVRAPRPNTACCRACSHARPAMTAAAALAAVSPAAAPQCVSAASSRCARWCTIRSGWVRNRVIGVPAGPCRRTAARTPAAARAGSIRITPPYVRLSSGGSPGCRRNRRQCPGRRRHWWRRRRGRAGPQVGSWRAGARCRWPRS